MSLDAGSAGTTRIRAGIVDVLVLAPRSGDGAARDGAARDGAASGADIDHRSGDTGDIWRVLALRRGQQTRCTGAWEIVHGRIEHGERPDAAALRETREETGFVPERMYSITVNPFYLVGTDSVELAIVFAAIVPAASAPVLADEHDAWEWLSPSAAMSRLAWPREREALAQALSLLATGDAGHVEDVLRVR